MSFARALLLYIPSETAAYQRAASPLHKTHQILQMHTGPIHPCLHRLEIKC